jgi:hypothetical protein
MGVGHHPCHHLYRLAAGASQRTAGESCRLTAASRLGLPSNMWPDVAARVVAGESLRQLGRQYGVSHECIRRIAQAVQ